MKRFQNLTLGQSACYAHSTIHWNPIIFCYCAYLFTSKDNVGGMAVTFSKAGVIVVVVDYTLCPKGM